MKLAFLFGPICTGSRPLDFAAIETSSRGLTGTDNSFLGYAKAMRQRGHEVTIYASNSRDCTWEGIPVRPYFYRREIDSTTDAALAWNDVHGLRWVPEACVRVLDMQLNNFDFARGPWLGYVDLFVAPSRSLLDRLRAIARGVGGVWDVLPNGCDPTAYTPSMRVPGRCIYTSSPDRGLHVLCEQWPRIKSAVPHATLKIFYHNLEAWIERIPEMEKGRFDMPEQARRARIIRDALPNLQGVERVGSVSRQQMAREYSEAEVLAYPCDTVGWTEGFGVAVLEGMAAGCVPVISECDAFGEVYAGACPMVHGKAGDNPDAWGQMVIDILRGEGSNRWRSAGAEFATRHAWPVLAEKLEGMLVAAKVRKGKAAA